MKINNKVNKQFLKCLYIVYLYLDLEKGRVLSNLIKSLDKKKIILIKIIYKIRQIKLHKNKIVIRNNLSTQIQNLKPLIKSFKNHIIIIEKVWIKKILKKW